MFLSSKQLQLLRLREEPGLPGEQQTANVLALLFGVLVWPLPAHEVHVALDLVGEVQNAPGAT